MRRHLNKFRKFYSTHFIEDDGDVGNGDGDVGAGGDNAGDSGGSGSADSSGGEVSNYFAGMPETWRADALTTMGLQPESEDFGKRMKQLDRVSDFGTLTKNYFEAQDKIRSGLVSTGINENSTPEEIQTYREANGIPNAPTEYNLGDGLVLGESDGRMVGRVLEVAHQHNIPNTVMAEITKTWFDARQAEEEGLNAQDGVEAQTGTRLLKNTWGGDYELNMNMVGALVNKLPADIQDAFKEARLGDGRALFNSPEIMIALADWSRQLNPSATVVPNSINPMATIDDEIATLEARMGDDDWHRDQSANDRLLKLYEAKENLQKQYEVPAQQQAS